MYHYSTQTLCKTKCSYVSVVTSYGCASITLFSKVLGYMLGDFTNYAFQLHWELTAVV